MVKEKITIVDGTYQIKRAVHADHSTVNAAGVYTDGAKRVLGFLVDGRRFGRLIYVMDSDRSKYRMELFPGYKKREPEDRDEAAEEAIATTTKIIKRVLPIAGIPILAIPGTEGDDIIYRLTEILSIQGYQVTVMSDDRDLAQVTITGAEVYQPIKDNIVTYDSFTQEHGFSPKYFTLFKAMTSDKSDKIPGISGVGPVTATNIIKQVELPTLQSLFSFIDTFDYTTIRNGTKIGKAMREGKDIIERNFKLVDLRHCPVTREEVIQEFNNLDYSFNQKLLVETLKLLGLGELIPRWAYFKN